MLPRHYPEHPCLLRRSPPGGQCRAAILPPSPCAWACPNSSGSASTLPRGGPTPAKMMTLVASALAGGDCIDDADVLRTGGTARALGGTVKAPSTLGTFLRSVRWGHVAPTGPGEPRVAGPGLGGAGPGDAPFTIDLDSTICETYGRQGGCPPPYTGKRGYHPLLAVAAGTGDADGPAARGPGQHRPGRRPLCVKLGRVRYGGGGQLTVRADSGFYTHSIASAASWTCASPSIRQHQSLHNPSRDTQTGRRFLTGWTALPMSPRPPTPPSLRLIVRLKPTPGYWVAITASLEEADHRRHAEIENIRVTASGEPSPLGPLRQPTPPSWRSR